MKVIVRADSSAVGRAAVEAAGGRVTHDLPIVDSVSAVLPAAAVAAVTAAPGVRAVTTDGTMQVQGTVEQSAAVMAAAGAAAGAGTDAAMPPSVFRKVIDVEKLNKQGYRGDDVTVALLDTGVSPSSDFGNRLLKVDGGLLRPDEDCVNLSGEPTCDDGYGHGTFLAGLIAGNGVASDYEYKGAAPHAKLVSIKVAAEDGSADVSNVLAGIQWAVSFKDEYDIQVLNLSLGTNSDQSWEVDPLNYAVEKAWKAGIVVVVAASNQGPNPGSISKPGDDPWVITVGATEDRATAKLEDDRMPAFSARGPAPAGVAKPDVVAPGAHVISLAAPGSLVAEAATPIAGGYAQGSGTSMATAIVSGAVAAVMSARPNFKPNRIKYILTATARSRDGEDQTAIGAGVINAYDAANKAPKGEANVGLSMSSGLGALDASRGDVYVEWDRDDIEQTVIEGEYTAQLLVWDPFMLIPGAPSWFGAWNQTTWGLFPWLGDIPLPWVQTRWSGDNWEGDNWEGCFKGGEYEFDCEYGDPESGSTWYGAWD